MLSNIFGEIKGVLNFKIVRNKRFEQKNKKFCPFVSTSIYDRQNRSELILTYLLYSSSYKGNHSLSLKEETKRRMYIIRDCITWDQRTDTNNTGKAIFHYSSYKLSDLEKRLSAKGLNYALRPIKLNYGNYMTPFELFYREIRKLPIEDHLE